MTDKIETKGTCTGDCKNCNVFQRGYCASQIAYHNMNTLAILQEGMEHLSERLKGFEEKLDTLRPEDDFIDPASAE